MGSVTELQFKDGDDGDEYNVSDVRITPIDNAYILEVYIDEEEIKEAYMDKSELLERLGELL